MLPTLIREPIPSSLSEKSVRRLQPASRVTSGFSNSPRLNVRASRSRRFSARFLVCHPLQFPSWHSSFMFAEPTDVFTVSYFSNEAGQLQAAQLTHENVTAGVAATRSLLPISHALSPLDTLVSAFSLSTAYGRTIAYTAIYEGTSFATLPSSKMYHADGCKPFLMLC